MMKKLAGLAAALFATTAMAGEYHVYTTLICSDCHTMHASRTHSFGINGQSTADTSTWGLGATGVLAQGNEALLVGSTVNRTCLTCHDANTVAPDVYGANNGRSANARSAGALNSGDLAELPQPTGYDSFMGHSLGWTNPPPGYDAARVVSATSTSNPTGTIGAWSGELECNRCHAVHGSSAYRNVGARSWTNAHKPSYTVVSTGSAIDPAYDVNEFGGGRNYDQNAIAYGAANGSTNGQYKMNQFCSACHGQFHDAGVTRNYGADGVAFQRHPTDSVTFTSNALVNTDAAITGAHGGFRNILGTMAASGSTGVKVIFKDNTATLDTGTGRATVVAGSSQMTIGCLTCHKAHGNQNSYGLIFYGDYTTGASGSTYNLVTDTSENGNGNPNVRSLCIQCHSMGRSNNNFSPYQ